MDDTIVALSTAPGVGAIAVIRLSGPLVFQVMDEVFSKKISDQKSHTLHFGKIKDGDEIIDEVVVGLFKSPTSYTKEDVVEISCHGSPFIQQTILNLLVSKECRLAKPGEFTERAFLNGAMDLSQAEAVADLIASESKASHQVAMNQMRGGVSNEIKELRQQLVDFASLIELELDFAEEDVEFADRTAFLQLVEKIQSVISGLIQSFAYGNAIKRGVNTVIAGRPNAGKSTLLNALLNEERAIVSDIEGTTRDTIEEILNINGIQFRLIDTAGLRDAQDKIETMGIEKTMEKIEQSNVLIYVFDITKMDPEAVQEDISKLKDISNDNVLLVMNKMDLIPNAQPKDFANDHIHEDQIITCSAINQMNIEYLKERLFNLVHHEISAEQTIITNARHLEALQKTDESLTNILAAMKANLSNDLVALDVRQAMHYLGEITGEISTDELLGNIFGKFCIGK